MLRLKGRLRRSPVPDISPVLTVAFPTLVTRTYGVTATLVDYHSWRQTITAMVVGEVLAMVLQ